MILELQHRLLELGLALLWLVVGWGVARHVVKHSRDEMLLSRMKTLLDRLHWASFPIVALVAVLMLEKETQAFAHALFIPTIVGSGLLEIGRWALARLERAKNAVSSEAMPIASR